MLKCKFLLFLTLFQIAFNGYSQQDQNFTKSFIFSKNTNSIDTAVKQPLTYNEDLGYGFDFETAENVNFEADFVTTKSSFYFSVKVPEGNYKIEVDLIGSPETTTTIKAESRRLMLKEWTPAKKENLQFSFSVNVRIPKISDEKSIAIKARDSNQLNWDNKLTLEFLGQPKVKKIKIVSDPSAKTIFLAGDSTVTDQDLEPWASWGQFITNYFTEEVVIANYAESGASLRSFKATNRFSKILETMRPGDYLFIEFGHNDEKIKGEGNGAWGLYSNLLREFTKEFQERNGKVILLTPTQRRAFNANGSLMDTHGDFPKAVRLAAKDMEIPLIDLTHFTTQMYNAWGDEGSRKAFVQYAANTFPGQTETLEDNTHFNSFGANEIARVVVQEIKNQHLEIEGYLRDAIPAYDSKKPNSFNKWTLPMSPRFESKKPDGN